MYLLMAVETLSVDLAASFERGRQVVGYTNGDVARLMGISEPLLCNQLKGIGNGHISLLRLASVAKKATTADDRPRIFVRVVFADLFEQLGLGECDPMAAAVGQALAVLGTVVGQMQCRMARATVPELQERRRA